MIRTTSRRRRGRPSGPAPTFLADCLLRLDATLLLAKTRGAEFIAHETPAGDLSGHWTMQWSEGGRPQRRVVALRVTTTAQRLGGVRHWWRCPLCHRRRGTLFAVSAESPLGCRRCLGLRYLSDYPGWVRRRRMIGLVRGLLDGGLVLDDERDLDMLLARRRRGVRRGRRVLLRAARSLMRLQARLDAVPDILQKGAL